MCAKSGESWTVTPSPYGGRYCGGMSEREELAQRVVALEAAVLALGENLELGGPGSGPEEGHPFRGNQWTSEATRDDEHSREVKHTSKVGTVTESEQKHDSRFVKKGTMYTATDPFRSGRIGKQTYHDSLDEAKKALEERNKDLKPEVPMLRSMKRVGGTWQM